MVIRPLSQALALTLGAALNLPFSENVGKGPNGGELHVESLFVRLTGLTATQTAGAITPIDGNYIASLFSQIGFNVAPDSPYAKDNPYGPSVIPVAGGLQVFNALMLMSGASLMYSDGGETWDRSLVNQPTPYDIAGTKWSVAQSTNIGKLNHQGPFGAIGVGGTLVATTAAPWDVNVPVGQLRNNENGSNAIPVGWLNGRGGCGGCCDSGTSGNLSITIGSTTTYGAAGTITLTASGATAQVFAVMSERPSIEAPIRFHIGVNNFAANTVTLDKGIHVATIFCENNASTGDDVISTMTSVTQIQVTENSIPLYGADNEMHNRWLAGLSRNASDHKQFVCKWPSTARTTTGTSASTRYDTGFVPLIVSGASLTQTPGAPKNSSRECPTLAVNLLNGTSVSRTLVQCLLLPNSKSYEDNVAKYAGVSVDDITPKGALAPSQVAAKKELLLPMVVSPFATKG